MKYYTIIIFCLFIALNGCTQKFRSRYDSIGKQTSYVSVKFELEEEKYIGKTKTEITDMLGNPVRVVKTQEQGNPEEKWIYYPEATNNYVAIIITFQGDAVKSASYESVI